MALSPSRRDVIGPPPRDVTDLARVVRHQGSYLRSIDPGLQDGRFGTPRPVPPGGSQLVGDDGGDGAQDIAFLNTDTGVVAVDGGAVSIGLTYEPIEGSEQVYYNGTPLKRTDWYRTDSVLTIPAETWFRSGKTAWVDYAYYPEDENLEPAAFSAVTMISGNYSSIDLPGTPAAGDMLVLVMRARDAATCSDPRMTPKNVDGSGKWGVWVGTTDGTGIPLAINLSGVSGAGDACAALMRITGAPLLPVTSEQSSSSSASPFTPAIPAAGTFGIMAITSGTGLVGASVSDDTLSNWTTRARVRGSGPGFASVYLGTAAGLPAGQWANAGGSPVFTAWAGGLQ